MARYSERRKPDASRATTPVLAATLLLIAWGVFAFGSVYPWAYTPLAVGCASIGALGAFTGRRSIDDLRTFFLTLAGFGALALVQLIPLPTTWLAHINPGTVAFLQRYDLGFSLPANAVPNGDGMAMHSISIASRLTLRGVLLFAAFAFLLIGLCRTLSRTSARQLTSGIVAIGCALAVFGIGQKAMLGDHTYGGMRIYGFWPPQSLLTTPFGPFVNKNHFAGWMLMATPLAIALAAASIDVSRETRRRGLGQTLVWLSGPEGGRVSMYTLSALVMSASLIMTGSRSGLLCMLIVVGGALFVMRRSLSKAAMLATGLVSVVILAGMLQWAGRDAAVQRFVQDSSSLSLRVSIWKTSFDIIRRAPVFGTGLDTFGTAMIVSEPDPGTVHYAEAHNEYVQLLVETGIVGLSLVLVAVGLAASATRERCHAEDDGTELRWIRRGAVIGLVAIAVQSLVEFSLQMPGNATLFVALLALALFKPAALKRGSLASPPPTQMS